MRKWKYSIICTYSKFKRMHQIIICYLLRSTIRERYVLYYIYRIDCIDMRHTDEYESMHVM